MDHYAYLVRRVRRIGPKIDVGCGKKCRAGFIGIDIREQGQDILWDVREGFPLPDSSVTHLHSSHFIEHLTDPEFRNFIVDVLRVCKPNGVVTLACPHLSSVEAYYHGHVMLWSTSRVKGFVLGFERGAKPGEKFFQILSLEVVGIELRTTLVVRQK